MSTIETAIESKHVFFPPSTADAIQNQKLECKTSIVVVGANGAGKSRLGAWLELHGPQKEKVHRITAQKSLAFPTSCSPIPVQSARDAFHYAPKPAGWRAEDYESSKATLRLQTRYGGEDVVAAAAVNDFGNLLTLLFSENYNVLLEHESKENESKILVPIPDTPIRRVQRLWESVLPNRQLKVLAGEIRAVSAGEANDYSARALSDGERVIFYLTGQCLCAPEGAIIVVDEPEIHLHKAIQSTLWNAIENARPDCTFVYLTHDLDFASGRTGAPKVCLKEFSNEKYDWYLVPHQEDIPEDVYLEVLGSRKPVLFVEGARGSLDFQIYQIAYPRVSLFDRWDHAAQWLRQRKRSELFVPCITLSATDWSTGII